MSRPATEVANQGLIYKIREASDTGHKGHFFEKKGTKNFTPLPLFNPFPKCLA